MRLGAVTREFGRSLVTKIEIVHVMERRGNGKPIASDCTLYATT